VNSSPGFEGLERATGVDCARAMIDYLVAERKGKTARTPPPLPMDVPLQAEHIESSPHTPKLVPLPAPSSTASLTALPTLRAITL
jgi:hypothetical protein